MNGMSCMVIQKPWTAANK